MCNHCGCIEVVVFCNRCSLQASLDEFIMEIYCEHDLHGNAWDPKESEARMGGIKQQLFLRCYVCGNEQYINI